jgi:HTH-type transcriptional regulator / antitoxin HigA
MDIHPIRTESDYLAALKTVEPYFDTEPDPASDAGEHFDILLALIQAYEARHHPVDPPDPIEAIKFRMDQQELTRKELAPMISRPNRVYGLIGASVESRLI